MLEVAYIPAHLFISYRGAPAVAREIKLFGIFHQKLVHNESKILRKLVLHVPGEFVSPGKVRTGRKGRLQVCRVRLPVRSSDRPSGRRQRSGRRPASAHQHSRRLVHNTIFAVKN